MKRRILSRFFVALLGVSVCVAAKTPSTQAFAQWKRPILVGWASDSGRFALDEAKLRALFPDFPWTADHLGYLNDHLDRGDSRAAIVASVKPLVISAYSDELDGVILVEFPDALADKYSLKFGDKLIASWIYPSLRRAPADIVQGEGNLRRYNNGTPLVADFFSNSVEKIKARKLGVSQKEWDRVQALTPAAMEHARGCYRSCFPLATGIPATPADGATTQK